MVSPRLWRSLRRFHEITFFPRAPKQMAMEGDKVFLPDDIIIDILKRLPVKSLIRFQSVCKDWKNLFKTPSFIADHLHHSGPKNSFLLLQRLSLRCDSLHLCLIDCKMEVREVQNTPLIDSLSHVRIVGSSNGLLCVTHIDDGGSPRSLILWNPAIREVRQVPRTINDFVGVCHVGFGFSPIVNDYKIVRIYLPVFYDKNRVFVVCKRCVNRVEVYSLSTGLWKEVEFGNLQSINLVSDTVITNGAMFWLGLKMDVPDDLDEDYPNLVVSFDMAMEVFSLIPMPVSASESNYVKLTVYDNKLAMISHSVIGNYKSSLIDLWVMEEISSASGENWRWTKKHSIGPVSGLLFPVSIWRNEIIYSVDKLPILRDETEDGKRIVLSLLNPITHELKKFDTFRYGYFYFIFNYEESLVSVGNSDIE